MSSTVPPNETARLPTSPLDVNPCLNASTEVHNSLCPAGCGAVETDMTTEIAVTETYGETGAGERIDAIPLASKVLVSCVSNATDTATQHYEPAEVIDWIRADSQFALKKPIAVIREKFGSVMATTNNNRKQAKTAVYGLKKKLPGALWSGTFRVRQKENLLEHSGLLCADLDELGDRIPEVRQKLLTSPNLYALFLSPTGDGLKAVFRVVADENSHKENFLAVEEHVRALTEVQIDESCKDVARLCFLSHDPDAYLNEEATELPLLPRIDRVEKATPPPISSKKLEARRTIAVELLGDIWDTERGSFCTCAGQQLHTAGDADTDCRVYLEEVPTISCFHNSCKDVIAETNRELRSRIGKAERLTPVEWFNHMFPALAQKFGEIGRASCR